MKVKSSPPPVPYNTSKLTRTDESLILAQAAEILLSRIINDSATPITSPEKFAHFLKYWFASHYDTTVERFVIIMLDSQHKVIAEVPTPHPLCTGTIDSASVYPREVVKAILRSHYPVAAVVLAHNHPSGSIEPSRADIQLTKRLKDALNLVDVRVLDHLIVSDTEGYYSFAESGVL